MAGNPIATGVLCIKAETTKDRVNKNEKGKRKLFLFKCCQSISLGQYYCHVYKFEIQRKRETEKRQRRQQAREAQREEERQTARASDKRPNETFFCRKNNIKIL